MTTKTVLITGATSGLGKATAHGMARLGYRVVVGGRDARRTEKAVDEIRAASGNNAVEGVVWPLSSRHYVRSAAQDVLTKCDRLDVLINNAATLIKTRRTTHEGLEATFMINYLAPFMLTELLLERLVASRPARIINVGSRTHHFVKAINFDDLQSQQSYRSLHGAFAQSKLALTMFSYELARRLADSGVTVNCVDPGFFRTAMTDSPAAPLYLKLLRPFLPRTPKRAVETVIRAATAPEYAETSGACLGHDGEVETSEASRDREAQARLWDVSVELAGFEAEAA